MTTPNTAMSTTVLAVTRASNVPHRWRNLFTMSDVQVVDNIEGSIASTIFRTIAAALGLNAAHLGLLIAAGKIASVPASPVWLWLSSQQLSCTAPRDSACPPSESAADALRAVPLPRRMTSATARPGAARQTTATRPLRRCFSGTPPPTLPAVRVDEEENRLGHYWNSRMWGPQRSVAQFSAAVCGSAPARLQSDATLVVHLCHIRFNGESSANGHS